MTLSHFDNDHINGVTELLRQFRVEALLLPYVPLWERLLIAFSQGISLDDSRWKYVLDPVAYLRDIGGDNLRRIIIIQQDDPENSPRVAEEFLQDRDSEELVWETAIPRTHTHEDEKLDLEFGSIFTKNEYLPSGQPIVIQGVWEFCPYNASRRSDHPPAFRSEVERLRNELLRATDQSRRDHALEKLKKVYDKCFGTSSKARNIISLFLYAGPIYSRWQQHKIIDPLQSCKWSFPRRYPCYRRVSWRAPGMSSKCSILYTGDGYLNTPAQFTNLRDKLTQSRIYHLGIVQVPHHGSKGNWHLGLAKKLNPVFSVFSSDPARGNTYHPDAEVLRDFWPFSPTQVNTNGASCCGWLI